MAAEINDLESRPIFTAGDLAGRIGGRKIAFDSFSAVTRAAYRVESFRPGPGHVAPMLTDSGRAGAEVKSGSGSAFQRFIVRQG